MFQFSGARAHRIQRPGRDVLLLPIRFVEARDQPIVRTGIHHMRIARVWHDISRFASAHDIPIRPVNGEAVAAAGDGHRRVVLLRSVDAVRHGSVRGHVIELRGRLIRFRRPTLPHVV